jgi:hypothetical protein
MITFNSGAWGGPQALRPQVEAWVLQGGGQALVASLLAAAADTCPRHLLRALGNALRALLADDAFRDPARQWVVHALCAPTFPGAHPWCLVKVAHLATFSASIDSHPRSWA